jgi:CheY-like chemotaxis protein
MKKLNILLVDDDSEESYLFNEALEHSGLHFHLYHANNGNDLMSFLLNEPPPDLVFIDINMPYKDGLEVLTELRDSPKFETLPLVIYSTAKNEDSINVCYEKGADLFVIKPNDFDEMVKVIRKVCTINWKSHNKTPRDKFVVAVEQA